MRSLDIASIVLDEFEAHCVNCPRKNPNQISKLGLVCDSIDLILSQYDQGFYGGDPSLTIDLNTETKAVELTIEFNIFEFDCKDKTILSCLQSCDHVSLEVKGVDDRIALTLVIDNIWE